MTGMVKTFSSLLVLLFILSGGATPFPAAVSAQGSPPVLAFYYAWFDGNTWTSGKPADIPVALDQTFLTINLESAEKIGMTIPADVLAQADRIIR